MNYLLLAIIVVLSAFLLLMIRSAIHQRRLRLSRRSWSFEEFYSEFCNSEVNSKLAIQYAYDDLVKLVGYPVKKWDNLESTLGLLPEVFEEILERRAQSLGIMEISSSQYVEMFPLKTVKDYVCFIDKILEN